MPEFQIDPAALQSPMGEEFVRNSLAWVQQQTERQNATAAASYISAWNNWEKNFNQHDYWSREQLENTFGPLPRPTKTADFRFAATVGSQGGVNIIWELFNTEADIVPDRGYPDKPQPPPEGQSVFGIAVEGWPGAFYAAGSTVPVGTKVERDGKRFRLFVIGEGTPMFRKLWIPDEGN